jgi:hypothetical protein
MQYKFEVDDALAADFEAGLAAAGFDPQSLFEKEVGDFARAHARKEAEDAKPPAKEVSVEGKVAQIDPKTDAVLKVSSVL